VLEGQRKILRSRNFPGGDRQRIQSQRNAKLLVLIRKLVIAHWVGVGVRKALRRTGAGLDSVVSRSVWMNAVSKAPYPWAARFASATSATYRKWKDHDSFQNRSTASSETKESARIQAEMRPDLQQGRRCSGATAGVPIAAAVASMANPRTSRKAEGWREGWNPMEKGSPGCGQN